MTVTAYYIYKHFYIDSKVVSSMQAPENLNAEYLKISDWNLCDKISYISII